jgi:hypothetical protein
VYTDISKPPITIVLTTTCPGDDTSDHTSASIFRLHLDRYVSTLSPDEWHTGFVARGWMIILIAASIRLSVSDTVFFNAPLQLVRVLTAFFLSIHHTHAEQTSHDMLKEVDLQFLFPQTHNQIH